MKKANLRLITPRYGKAKVRVLKVSREGARHSLKELEVAVSLQGDFEASYTQADNRKVIPTDTMKNTVYVLAKERLGSQNEEFGLALGEHFLKTYPQIERVEIGLSERCWERMEVGGKPQEHAFTQHSQARPAAIVTCSRSGHSVQSGVEDLLILKSTESGFAGYVQDEYTTLKETTDRILATKLKALWTYQERPATYSDTNAAILQALLSVFARNYSPSVQVTLFEMGEAALAAAPEISQITLAMPNKHCLLANLAPFDRENLNEIFIPTDEPHGQIEGTVSRA